MSVFLKRPKNEYLDDPVVPHLKDDWNEIGSNLDILEHVLGRVKQEHHNIPETCASRLFYKWLKHSSGTGRKERTWKTILTSFRDSGREDIVENVISSKEQYTTYNANLVILPFINYSRSTHTQSIHCLLYTSPSPRDRQKSRMPSSA